MLNWDWFDRTVIVSSMNTVLKTSSPDYSSLLLVGLAKSQCVFYMTFLGLEAPAYQSVYSLWTLHSFSKKGYHDQWACVPISHSLSLSPPPPWNKVIKWSRTLRETLIESSQSEWRWVATRKRVIKWHSSLLFEEIFPLLGLFSCSLEQSRNMQNIFFFFIRLIRWCLINRFQYFLLTLLYLNVHFNCKVCNMIPKKIWWSFYIYFYFMTWIAIARYRILPLFAIVLKLRTVDCIDRFSAFLSPVNIVGQIRVSFKSPGLL